MVVETGGRPPRPTLVLMPIDIDRVRHDTPATASLIHFNNAGSSLPPRPVTTAVIEHIELEETIGGYEAAGVRQKTLELVPVHAARLLNCDPNEVAVTTSDTDSFSRAFWGYLLGGALRRDDVVLVDRITYTSHYLALLQAVRHAGIRLRVVPSDPAGAIDLEALDRMLAAGAALVTATHVGTHRGLVNPAADIGRLARAARVPFFLDACQSVGQMPVDVATIGCDVLTVTGRKFLRAPRGTGLLYMRREIAQLCDPPGIDGGVSAKWVDDTTYCLAEGARRFESFESSIASRIGLGVALEYALEIGLEAIAERVGALADDLRRRLESLPGVHVHDGGHHRSAIVTFTIDGQEPMAIQEQLVARHINCSVSRAPSARLDQDARGLPEVVRLSPHYYNTEDEIDVVARAVTDLATR
jgi:selenocysteine lyase/cysteine desulfurase